MEMLMPVSPEDWIIETVLVESTLALEALPARLSQLVELSKTTVQQPIHLLHREDQEAFADLIAVIRGCEKASALLRDCFATLPATALAEQLKLHAGLCELSRLIAQTHDHLSAINEATLICGRQHRDPALGLASAHVH